MSKRSSMTWLLALRNLRSDAFGTICAVLGVALGVATVCAVFVLDENTRAQELHSWKTNPNKPVDFSASLLLSARPFTAPPTPSPLTGHPQARRARSEAKPNEGPAGELASPLTGQSGEDPKEEMHEDYQIMRFLIRTGSLTAFLVGALIVFFTFRVVVEQRKREVALLRSLGATPKEVARIFFLEALLVGTVGAAFGLLLSVPLAELCAALGITTTGRSELKALHYPVGTMLTVGLLGAITSVLGVLRPVRQVLQLDVPRALRPELLEGPGKRRSGLWLLLPPMVALFYVLIRPFFKELLPSLAVLAIEAGLVCALFIAVLILTPGVLGIFSRLILWGPRSVRLLLQRRLQRASQDFAWPVSGVTLVFALLLALHGVVYALSQEVNRFGATALDSVLFFHSDDGRPIPEDAFPEMPARMRRLRSSSRTPWPNVLIALNTEDLKGYSENMDPEAQKLAARLGPGKVILSRLLARRLGLSVGGTLHAKGSRPAKLEVIGIRDDIGYYPIATDSYRNSKTFGVISAEDFDLIEPWAKPVGAHLAFRAPERGPINWPKEIGPIWRRAPYHIYPGSDYRFNRLMQTERDFFIFDVILLLTGFLAAVGIANNLVLAAHIRRKELQLYRVLGMSGAQRFVLCLLEGASIGLLGGLIAVALGVPLGWTAIEALKLVSTFEVHYVLVPYQVGFALAFAVALAAIASVYPALITRRKGANAHLE